MSSTSAIDTQLTAHRSRELARVDPRGLLYAAYLFVGFVFVDFSKYPASYSGLVAPFDFVGAGTALLAAIAMGAYLLELPRLRIDLVGLLAVGAMLGFWILTVLAYEPAAVTSYRFIEASDYSWPGYGTELAIVVKYAVGLIVVPLYFSRYIRLATVLKILVAAAVIHACFGLYQLGFFVGLWGDVFPIRIGQSVNGEFFSVFGRASGFLTNPFPYGVFLQLASIACFFIFRATGRRRWMVLAVFLGLASLLSLSKSLLLGWGVIALLYTIYARNRAAYLISLAGIAVLVVAVATKYLAGLTLIEGRLSDTYSVESRLATNRAALDAFLQQPLLGHGIGHRFVTDSTYASLLLEGGIFRLLSYVGYWGWIVLGVADAAGSANPIRREVARAFLLFLLAFLVQSALVGTAERMPVILGIMSLFFVLRHAVPPQPPKR